MQIRWPLPEMVSSWHPWDFNTNTNLNKEVEDVDDVNDVEDYGMLKRTLIPDNLFRDQVGNVQSHFLNSESHLGPSHVSIKNSNVDDELSRVEKLLSKKIKSSILTKDGKEVQWVEGDWTECLDSECFNWNTGILN